MAEKYKLFKRIHKYFDEMGKRHKEKHRRERELHNKIRELYKDDKELEWYHKHNKYSQIFIIIFNLVIWVLIFRYFGAKTVTIAFAVLTTIGGIVQFLFHMGIERRILKPIGELKFAVDEISKGNYDVSIKYEMTNEISALIDSFNEMAQKLQESENLKRAYEENRKTLIANISHDLKTPITSIQGYIEAMQERTDISQDNIDKYHQIIYNNAAYINKLIDDLFLFSKLDLQKLELQIEQINAKAFMGDLMEEFKYELEDRGIKFDYNDNITKDYYVNIDRKRINQVFRNIIGNAVKYGFEENTIINAKIYLEKDFVCIDIVDNGPGIPEDKLPYIFDRFYRVDYARTKDLMSTGLGLAIAKELVEAHEGRIAVSSTENVGSCFTIMLPIKI